MLRQTNVDFVIHSFQVRRIGMNMTFLPVLEPPWLNDLFDEKIISGSTCVSSTAALGLPFLILIPGVERVEMSGVDAASAIVLCQHGRLAPGTWQIISRPVCAWSSG